MKTSLKAVLTASIMLALPINAFAQSSTSVDSTTPPSAEKAEQMKNQSYSAHNPTEQNKTYKNQMQEQPDPKAPSAPSGMMGPTGATSGQMPISSPQHENAGKHRHSKKGSMKGMNMSDKSAQQ